MATREELISVGQPPVARTRVGALGRRLRRSRVWMSKPKFWTLIPSGPTVLMVPAFGGSWRKSRFRAVMS